MHAQGLYDPTNEHDSCGVGFIAHIKGLDAFTSHGNGMPLNWHNQGADAGLYENSEIHAVRILAMEGHNDITLGHMSLRDPQGRGLWLKKSKRGLDEIAGPDDSRSRSRAYRRPFHRVTTVDWCGSRRGT